MKYAIAISSENNGNPKYLSNIENHGSTAEAYWILLPELTAIIRVSEWANYADRVYAAANDSSELPEQPDDVPDAQMAANNCRFEERTLTPSARLQALAETCDFARRNAGEVCAWVNGSAIQLDDAQNTTWKRDERLYLEALLTSRTKSKINPEFA